VAYGDKSAEEETLHSLGVGIGGSKLGFSKTENISAQGVRRVAPPLTPLEGAPPRPTGLEGDQAEGLSSFIGDIVPDAEATDAGTREAGPHMRSQAFGRGRDGEPVFMRGI